MNKLTISARKAISSFFTIALTASSTMLMAPNSSQATESLNYDCGIASVYISPEDGISEARINGRLVQLRPEADGAYRNQVEEVQFYRDGAITLYVGSESFNCRVDVSNASQPQSGGNAVNYGNLPARSLGGKMRSGPGLNYSQSGSLQEGDRITIIANTGIRFDGYDWYQIRHRGRIGFQWGGIMCSEQGKIPGIFANCADYMSRYSNNQGNNPGSSALHAPGRSLGGKMRSGPGINYRHLGSLQEGERIRIVRNTGVRMNGYDWFEILYHDRSAYQWGGIMCSEQGVVNGIYANCSNYR